MTTRKDPALPDEPPTTEVAPSAAQQPNSVTEFIAESQPVIDLVVTGHAEDARNGMNLNDLIRYAIGSPDRTKNLERIIWATTGLIALFAGLISGIVIFATQYRVAGSVGLAAAVIAGISGPIAKIGRWVRRRRRSAKHIPKP